MRKILKKILVPSILFLFLATSVQAAALKVEFPGTKAADWVISEATSASNTPWYLKRLGPVYDFNLLDPTLASSTLVATSSPSATSSPVYLEMTYPASNSYKNIYVLSNGAWQALPTVDYPGEKKVRATFNALNGRVALFSRPEILTSGRASWYKYKGGNFAASPDFKKGSVIRVYNTANNKSVDVTINDYGPDRLKHPDRVLDLDKEAFKKIANAGDGLINIRIEPLKFSFYEDDVISNTSAEAPQISAKSAVIFRESDGQILWGKNQDVQAPLASLTKIVAAKIFLDTKPNLSKVVAYKKQDELYNYEYCRPGEAALLKLKDGETASLNDFLNSALIGSANNAVETFVRASGLKREEFIKRMNDWVKKIGATSTSFVEPTGLAPQNVSSPADYAIITKEAYKNQVLQKISTTWQYKFSTRNTKKKHTITNTNKLLDLKKYALTGSKTGYLEEAGYCLMTRAKTKADSLVVVNFGSRSSANSFKDNEQLLKFGLQLINQ